jgi:hypothetical protein
VACLARIWSTASVAVFRLVRSNVGYSSIAPFTGLLGNLHVGRSARRSTLGLVGNAVAASHEYDGRHEQDGHDLTNEYHGVASVYSPMICAGSFAAISGVPRKSVIVPVTHTRLLA